MIIFYFSYTLKKIENFDEADENINNIAKYLLNNNLLITNSGKLAIKSENILTPIEVNNGNVQISDYLVIDPSGNVNLNNYYKYIKEQKILKKNNNLGYFDASGFTYINPITKVDDTTQDSMIVYEKYNESGQIVDSTMYFDEIVILKKAEDVTATGPLHIKEVSIYENETAGYIDTPNKVTITTNNMFDENNNPIDNNLVSNYRNILFSNNATNWLIKGSPNVENRITFSFSKPSYIKSIYLYNALVSPRENLKNTYMYFKKNGIIMYKILITPESYYWGTSTTAFTDNAGYSYINPISDYKFRFNIL